MSLRAAVAGLLLLALPLPGGADAMPLAIVTLDRVALRAAPRGSAPIGALLWQGETVEVRGERLEYLQVYDYRRERGGFVRSDEVQRIALTSAEAPQLLAIVRLLRAMPGAEALGIGYAAAYVEAASADVLASEAGGEALDALGGFAERLAERASVSATLGKRAQAALAGHLDVAARYGANFANREREGRSRICYDGEAYRRVLVIPSSAQQRARAALALTRPECMPAGASGLEHIALEQWRAEVLDRVELARVSGPLRNRILMRRATTWASLSYLRSRRGETARAEATRALTELTSVDRGQLGDEDLRTYNDAAMRVAVSRWAAAPDIMPATANPRVIAAAGRTGETCVLVVDAKNDERRPLARRCTYGIVWTASASANRDRSAFALAVQPTESWLELWIARRSAHGWSIRVLPPAAASPHVGYVEFAGWVPGGKQMLVAREARSEGSYRRSFEVLRLDTLATVYRARDPDGLPAFRRWQDASWKSRTVSVR